MTPSMHSIGIDVGGTFTDLVAVSLADGGVIAGKALSTPHDQSVGVEAALTAHAPPAAAVARIVHGTTVVTNMLLERRGARVALCATEGATDLLLLRRQERAALYDLSAHHPAPLVEPSHVVAVSERIAPEGVVRSLGDGEARRVADAVAELAPEIVAVALLHSYADASHERLLGEALRARLPDVDVVLSSDVLPEIREYERTATTACEAYARPGVGRYLARLGARLESLALPAPGVVSSSGGMRDAADAARHAASLALSGPAGGVAGAAIVARLAGFERALSIDIGGTSADVGLILGGEPLVEAGGSVAGVPIALPRVLVETVSAGGGSIAWVDDTRLRIGPQSAGGDPGPASYGWGGTLPTVTDADLVLGFLNPDRFLSGRLRLDRARAERAIGEHVAGRLFDGDVVQAAAGIRRVVDAQMGDLVRKATIERGHDPRSFVLMSYGGAGPLHAAGYARGLGVGMIVVPPAATAYSAYGAAASDIRHSLQRSVRAGLLEDEHELTSAYARLEEEARGLVLAQQVPAERTRVMRWADMRYRRQLHDVRVTLPPDTADGTLSSSLAKVFSDRYQALYGAGAVLPNLEPQLLRIGVEVVGLIDKPPVPAAELAPPDPSAAALPSRRVFWPEEGGWIETPIYDGPALRPGNALDGPAVIEQPGTTVVVPAGARAELDRYGNTLITLGQGSRP